MIRNTDPQQSVDVLILGAGCAGTSLAAHLENLGYNGTIALLDARTDFGAEARWCSWSPQNSIVSCIVSRRWKRWQVRGQNKGDNRIVRCGDGLAYEEIYAPDFFARFHRNWRRENSAKPIQLHPGQTIEAIEARAGGVTVTANGQQWRARQVFDARGGGVGRLKQLDKPGHLRLHQTFLGRIIEFERGVFDEKTATLMDFRLPQGARSEEGVKFAYILPQTRKRALIETTAFGCEPLGYEQHDELLRAYIGQHFGHDYRVTGEECGDLPMASAPINPQLGPNWRAIGIAGGAARPSSGYAFARIQRETEAIACALAQNQPLPTPAQCRGGRARARKYAVLDEIFLEVIGATPRRAIECFTRLFSEVPPAALVRFLSETSTLADDAQIIAALPKMPFLSAAHQRAAARLRTHLPASLPLWSPDSSPAPGIRHPEAPANANPR